MVAVVVVDMRCGGLLPGKHSGVVQDGGCGGGRGTLQAGQAGGVVCKYGYNLVRAGAESSRSAWNQTIGQVEKLGKTRGAEDIYGPYSAMAAWRDPPADIPDGTLGSEGSPRSVDGQLTAPLHGIGLGRRFDKRGRPCARDGERFPWPPGPLLARRPRIHAHMQVALSRDFLWGFCADEPPCRRPLPTAHRRHKRHARGDS